MRTRKRRRTAKVDHGLLVLASIVENLRASVGQFDDAEEETAITAAIRWIRS